MLNQPVSQWKLFKMLSPFIIPTRSKLEAETHETFEVLRRALSFPGRIWPLSQGLRIGYGDMSIRTCMSWIGSALLDLETSFYCADDALAKHLGATGAQHKPIADAEYIFLPSLDLSNLSTLAWLNVGDLAYPDRGASVIVGADFDWPSRHIRFSGPGIAKPQFVMLNNVLSEFWALREKLIRYPLGFDTFFVSDGFVMGLPRTTEVKI